MPPAGNFAAARSLLHFSRCSRTVPVNDFRDATPLKHPDTSILLIRHGETVWNRSGRMQGWQDSPLSAAGVAQAQALAERFASDRVARLISSDLGRAQETARPIAARLGIPIEIDPAMRERNYGIFEGRTHDEIERDHPVAYASFSSRDPAYVIPGGESAVAFAARVLRALERIAVARAGDRVAVVTHGGVLGVVYRHVMKVPADAERGYTLANASVNHVWFAAGEWFIERWGDVAHLADTAADDPTD
jgi:2,3-bisphosphoglycerate-dependent phosphoglycerate mutase